MFVLKNKTGKEATAIYLYPAGSENRYENILTENWPTCEDESQYRYIVIERPIAETYEMTAEFADGTTLSYEGRTITHTVDPKAEGGIATELWTEALGKKARYISIVAKNPGPCPDWHPGKGGSTWIFADEVLIETR